MMQQPTSPYLSPPPQPMQQQQTTAKEGLSFQPGSVRLRADGIRGDGLRSAYERAQRMARCNVPRLQGADGRSGCCPTRAGHGIRKNRLRVHHLQDRDRAAVQRLVTPRSEARRPFAVPPTVLKAWKRLGGMNADLAGHLYKPRVALRAGDFRFCSLFSNERVGSLSTKRKAWPAYLSCV